MRNHSSEEKTEWRPPGGRWDEGTGSAMVAAFDASGLSMKAFAAKHGLGAHRVSYWRAKAAGAGPGQQGGFVRVRVAAVAAIAATLDRTVEVRLRNGRSLMIRGGWDEASVRTWVRALEASS